MTRRHVDALSVDALECVLKVANETDEPDYNIVDAHIEPDEVKIPSGKDLDPEAVIAARRREMQNLIDFEAFEWVKTRTLTPRASGSVHVGRTWRRTIPGNRRCEADGCCRKLRHISPTTSLRPRRRR